MSTAIDVGIGLGFVFALVALICTGLQEMVSATLNLRGKTLWEGVESMLQAQSQRAAEAAAKKSNTPVPTGQADGSPGMQLTRAIQAHPLIRGLIPDRFGMFGFLAWIFGMRQPSTDIGNAKPSYMQASTFATALADQIGKEWKGGSRRFDDLGLAVANMPDGDLKTILQGMVRDTQGDPAKLRATIEAWYDETMVRVGGWYKRRVQSLLLLIGLVVAGAMNVDAIHIGAALATQPELRKSVADRATAAAQAYKDEPSLGAEERAAKAEQKLRDLNLPIGWTGGRPVKDQWDMVAMIVGWLVTALAASFGAPFWFDLIGKLVPLRSAGAKPPSVPEPPAETQSASFTAATNVALAPKPGETQSMPFLAALNDYEANGLAAAEILEIKRLLGIEGAGAQKAVLDQPTRDAIVEKQAAMKWPQSGQLSASFVKALRTGGA